MYNQHKPRAVYRVSPCISVYCWRCSASSWIQIAYAVIIVLQQKVQKGTLEDAQEALHRVQHVQRRLAASLWGREAYASMVLGHQWNETLRVQLGLWWPASYWHCASFRSWRRRVWIIKHSLCWYISSFSVPQPSANTQQVLETSAPSWRRSTVYQRTRLLRCDYVLA
jgi:hypothetical protein